MESQIMDLVAPHADSSEFCKALAEKEPSHDGGEAFPGRYSSFFRLRTTYPNGRSPLGERCMDLTDAPCGKPAITLV